jgi:outer membrane protein assembly factor BamB
VLLLVLLPARARAADQPQWGQRHTRNMVSPETGLPDGFDPAAGTNVKWVAPLGSQTYASPVVAGGRVYLGTNNDRPRDPRHQGDRAVLLCLDEKDGRLLWQFVIPKLSVDYDDPFLDWEKAGFCSEPTIEGDRAYTLTNRGEVVCLDVNGLADGNDGPYLNEAKHLALRRHAPVKPSPTDADIVWRRDLVADAGIRTHDQVHGSILVDGDLLYVNSCNGKDNTHRRIVTPDAPTLVVLDKRTGQIVARDGEHIGPNVFHCAWSSPSLGEVNGKRLIFFGGPDGWCYAFEALAASPLPAPAAPDPNGGPDGPAQGGVAVTPLTTVWKFDCDPAAPKEDVHKYVGNRRVSPSVIMGMPVFDKGRVYVSAGGDLWWGKRQGWLKCIDAGGSGDVTRAAEVWSYPLSRETCCTPAVYNGMVFATDCGGVIHCVDAATGKPHWTHKADGDIWGSPLVADGKVFVGTRRGEFVVLAADKQKRLISTTHVGEGDDSKINGTVTAANGVLYVPTMSKLYALQRPAQANATAPR